MRDRLFVFILLLAGALGSLWLVPAPAFAAAQQGSLPIVRPETNTLPKVKNVEVVAVTTDSVKLRWERQTNTSYYLVRILDANDDLVKQKKTTRRSITIGELTADTAYGTQVKMVRGKRKGPWSKRVEFSTEAEEESLYDQYKAIAGTMTGEWQNLTFGTSGDATVTIEIDPDGRAAFTIDLGGLVFGLIDPDPKTYESTYDESGAVFTATDDDLFGDLVITITANDNDTGGITVEALEIPIAGINKLTASGTLYSDSADLNYQITFTDESTADGIMNLTKE